FKTFSQFSRKCFKFLFVHNLPVSVVGVKISKTGNYTILFTVSSKAIDTDIHNVMLITSFMDRGVIIAFNSTEELWNTYSDSAKASLLSITFDR
ncbi:hypothetical protein C6P85_22200, partial [Yersinia pestis]